MTTALTNFRKNAVITGANRGLELELCKQLCQVEKRAENADVHFSSIFAVCRKSSPALTALAKEHPKCVTIVEGIDVTSDEAPEQLSAFFESTNMDETDLTSVTPIHLLIQNAGGYGPPESFDSPEAMYDSQTLDNITPQRLRYSIELNTIGPLFLTKALLPNLKAAVAAGDDTAKVAIISSAMGSIADNTSGKHYGYRTAKAAVNMVGKSLSVDLKDDNIAVGMIHPGFLFTDFGGNHQKAPRPGQRSVQDGTTGVIEAIKALTIETTGSFFHGNYGEGVYEMKW
jgi:NAD(P)-dependent dehydrogenase (short-subunit alcohol dehydrogenase family)